MNSKVIVAAAGSGKTTYLIDSALNYTNNTIILTYTTNNESSIKKRLIQKSVEFLYYELENRQSFELIFEILFQEYSLSFSQRWRLSLTHHRIYILSSFSVLPGAKLEKK